jgi:hypothetical protein
LVLFLAVVIEVLRLRKKQREMLTEIKKNEDLRQTDKN